MAEPIKGVVVAEFKIEKDAAVVKEKAPRPAKVVAELKAEEPKEE